MDKQDPGPHSGRGTPVARYHIYVAPLLQTRIDDLYWVSHSSLRLLRRIVKGYVTQQWPAERSFAEWAKLQHAGDVNVVPHLQNADVVFNSAAEYELSVLKVRPLVWGRHVPDGAACVLF